MFSIFKSLFNKTPLILIQGERLYLRQPSPDDFEAWAKLRQESQAFLSPWEPVWETNELNRASYRQRLCRIQTEMETGEACSVFLIRQCDHQLLGGLTLGNIRRGAAQTATLGYWMGQKFAGQRYMSMAVALALDYAFNELGLRRIEAASLPENHVSIKLLQTAGFKQEGLARQYLNIAGAWRDHILFAILASDFQSVNKAKKLDHRV